MLRSFPAPPRDYTYDFLVDLQIIIDEVVPLENRLGLTLEDYKCPHCGYLAAASFANSRKLFRCRRCLRRFDDFVDPQIIVDEKVPRENCRGLPLEAYKCPHCGYLAAASFVIGRRPFLCLRCRRRFDTGEVYINRWNKPKNRLLNK